MVFAAAVVALAAGAVVVGDGVSALVLVVTLRVVVAAADAVVVVAAAAAAHVWGAEFVAAGRGSSWKLGLIPCKSRIQATAASRSSGGFSSHLLQGYSRSKLMHGHCKCLRSITLITPIRMTAVPGKICVMLHG